MVIYDVIRSVGSYSAEYLPTYSAGSQTGLNLKCGKAPGQTDMLRGAGTTLKLGGGGKRLPGSKVTPTQN